MFLTILISIVVGIILFYNFAPIFGAKIKTDGFEKIENFKDGKFHNTYNSKLHITDEQKEKDENWIKQMINPVENREPKEEIKVNKLNLVQYNSLEDNSLVWHGHSTVTLKLSGKTMLVDPMFGERPSPVPFLIKKRYTDEMVLDLELLPVLDAVIITHDHYDHLDYYTIKALKNRVKKFIVPIGVDQHLLKWGVEREKIETLKWWDSLLIEETKITLVPSQHFSGRRLTKNPTLWGGYVIEENDKKILISGDSGYGTHFKEIKNRFGSIDFALLESGQYNSNWADIHMMPNHTVQAAVDLGVENFMTVHWGMFTLSTHTWTDPVEQVAKAAKNNNKEFYTPEIGMPLKMFEKNVTKEWWKK